MLSNEFLFIDLFALLSPRISTLTKQALPACRLISFNTYMRYMNIFNGW